MNYRKFGLKKLKQYFYTCKGIKNDYGDRPTCVIIATKSAVKQD